MSDNHDELTADRLQLEYLIQRHQAALHALNEIAALPEIDLQLQLRQALEIAARYLELDTATINQVDGGKYNVLVRSGTKSMVENAEGLELCEIPCSVTLKINDTLAIPDMGNSVYVDHPGYEKFNAEAYIGSPVKISGEVFGTICFTSASARKSDFSLAEVEFVRLLGRWIASTLERRQYTDSLRDTASRLTTIMDNVVDGIITIDEQGIIDSFNIAAEKIFGYSANEVVGQNVSMLMTEPYRSQHDEYIQRYLKDGDPRIIGVGREVMGQRKDGSTFPLDLAVSDVTQEDKRIFTGIVRDITDRKASEKAIVAARDEAEKANHAKSDFLASMSHELRTPLNAILGFSQLLNYGDSLSEEHKDNVREIDKAGNHLLELINDVLDLAKIESGHIDLSIGPVELITVVKDCFRLIKPEASRSDIQLVSEDLKGIVVRADQTRLKQALLNLISNAVKYNREGGSVHIKITTGDTNQLKIMVTDTGPGISEESQGQLFQPFNRLDAENSGIEGTGIGLTLTRQIIELMEGSVGVESSLGAGSTFWIELPLESNSAPIAKPGDVQKDTDGFQGGEKAINPQTFKVLYIEDNPANLKLVSRMLASREYIHLLTAHTSKRGIELAQTTEPDLILLDVNLPGMDGYEVLQILKYDFNLMKIPVFAVTANAMPREIERGKSAGFDEYITKPIQVESFLEKIDAYLPAGESGAV